jgi:uncharacterized protein
MNRVVHFEMPYDDPDRVMEFYATAFGWSMKNAGEQMGNYVLATTTATSADGVPKEPGAINGGFFQKNPDGPAQCPSVVIAVDDLRAAMESVNSAGGDVVGEPIDIPGIGAFVSFNDSEGNRVGMLEPLQMAKPKAARPAAKKPAGAKAKAKKKSKAKKSA